MPDLSRPRFPAYLLLVPLSLGASAPARAGGPGLQEVVQARRDLWGEAAMRQPDGASLEFFRPLLPPPRYVHADFRHYPIVLCAPGAGVKARFISNGSGLNLPGGSRSWNDVGTPVTFRVGPDEFLFGGLRDRLEEPTLAEGWLPIVEVRYRHPFPVQAEGQVPLDQAPVDREHEVYRQEVFAGVDPAFAGNAVVFVRFSLAAGATGLVTADVRAGSPVKLLDGRLIDDQGRTWAWFDPSWTWERGAAHARITSSGRPATMVLPARPFAAAGVPAFTAASFDEQRAACVAAWKSILDRAMVVDVPEPYVNNAWRNLVAQIFLLLNGDRVHYSAGNQYDRLYMAEGSDAALALMSWGYEEEMRRLIGPLLEFHRPNLEYHAAGFKLLDVCRLFWQTRDAGAVEALRARWEPELRRLTEGRTPPNGLYPREQYCGDIHTMVYSLSANAKAWRAIRDIGVVLGRMGREQDAARLAELAAGFRKDILSAVARSARRETDPPFVPMALLDIEPAHDPITAVRIGSYWGVVINYVIGSGIFPPGCEEENWIPRYLEQHGGLCMGMTRSGAAYHGFWSGPDRTNPLYGTRYVLDLLRRDDPERAIVSFYGMLAQGLTPNTYVGGEGTCLTPLDEGGRFFYCPPNSASAGHVLTMLRSLLVQDLDLDDDGAPETLRLLFATPRRWLADGRNITVRRAPTAFGPVSVKIVSDIAHRLVRTEVELPLRNPAARTLLRVRLPGGARVVAARGPGRELAVDREGTVDLTALSGRVAIEFEVAVP